MECMRQLNQPVREHEAGGQGKSSNLCKTQAPQAFAAACQQAENAGNTKAGANMTMEQYKLYIYDKISNIPLNPTRNNWDIFVFISEEGFEAMKNNPEYEKWVLDKIRMDFARIDPFQSNTTQVMRFGASKKDYECESYTMPSKRDLERARKECWERKEALKKKLKKMQDRKWLLEKWYKQDVERKYIQLKRLDHADQVQEENRALRFGGEYGMEDRSASIYAAARRKAKFYEASFMYHGM